VRTCVDSCVSDLLPVVRPLCLCFDRFVSVVVSICLVGVCVCDVFFCLFVCVCVCLVGCLFIVLVHSCC
jgi:hypothetical protein